MNTVNGVEVLIVEDNEEDAEYIERLLLKGQEFETDRTKIEEIYRAGELATALELMKKEPDIVLLDLGLPDSQGLETLETAIETSPDMPVVVITGHQESELGTRAIREGAQDYLQKGKITNELLHRTIRYAIDRHEKKREIIALNQRLSILNQVIRQDIHNDISLVIGKGNQLRDSVPYEDQSTLASLLDAADRTLDRITKAGKLTAVFSAVDEPPSEFIDLTEVLEKCVQRFRSQTNAKISLDLDTIEGDTLTVEASTMLESAFDELLENAIQHNENKEPAVSVKLRQADGQASVVFTDDGVGISTAQRERLNEPETRYFEQASIGTGLYFTMSVIEQSGGSITFAENHPRGTRVTVSLVRVRD